MISLRSFLNFALGKAPYGLAVEMLITSAQWQGVRGGSGLRGGHD